MGSKGVTLVELGLVIVVAGILLLIALPRISVLRTRTEIRNARGSVAALIQQSRLRAIHESRSMTVHFTDSTVWITGAPRRSASATPCGCDTVVSAQNLLNLYGASINVTPDTLRLDPRGLSLLTGAVGLTVVLVRSGTFDTLRVNPMGHVGM